MTGIRSSFVLLAVLTGPQSWTGMAAAADTPHQGMIALAADQSATSDADVRKRAEDLAGAASERFTQIMSEKDKPAAKDDKQTSAAPASEETAEGGFLAPVWDWLAQASKEYQDVIIVKLKDPSSEPVVMTPPDAAGKEPPAAPVTTAQAPAEPESETAAKSEPEAAPSLQWGSITNAIQEWLARANRSYRNEVVKKLRTPLEGPEPGAPPKAVAKEEPAPAKEAAPVEEQVAQPAQTPTGVELPEGNPKRIADAEAKRNAEAERQRLAEEETKRREVAAEAEAEKQRLADAAEAERKAEAERQRLAEEEAERKADEAEKQRLAEAAEAKRKADEAERQHLAAEAEAKRKAEAEKQRLAEEAEAKRKAEAERQRLAAEAEAQRKAEAEAEAEAEATRVAAAEAARKEEAEKQRLAEEAATKRKAAAAAVDKPERKPAPEKPVDVARATAPSAAGAAPERESSRLATNETRAPEPAASEPAPSEPAASEPASPQPAEVPPPVAERKPMRMAEASGEASEPRARAKRHIAKKHHRKRHAAKSHRRKRAHVHAYRRSHYAKPRVRRSCGCQYRRRCGQRVRHYRQAAAAGTYVVRRGDTLWGIARRHYGNGAGYRRIYRANRGHIRNPNRIYVNQRIYVP